MSNIKLLNSYVVSLQRWVRIYNIYPTTNNCNKSMCRLGVPDYKLLRRTLNMSWSEFLIVAGYKKKFFTRMKPKRCKCCGVVTRIPANSVVEGNSFCSQSCGAKWRNSNLDRSKSAESRLKQSKSMLGGRISKKDLRKLYKTNPKLKQTIEIIRTKYRVKNYTDVEMVCEICGKNYVKLPGLKYCSRLCGETSRSEKASKRMLLGTTNISTRVDNFSYNKVRNINLDSKLEAAGIIYLVDVLGAVNIERFISILNFRDEDGKNHKFNPDFICNIGNKTYVVEVKQIYKESSPTNLYNRFFKEKQLALNRFCSERGFVGLWLDFDYDSRFRKIYRQVLKNFTAYQQG